MQIICVSQFQSDGPDDKPKHIHLTTFGGESSGIRFLPTSGVKSDVIDE
jgi:hypothetical protein